MAYDPNGVGLRPDARPAGRAECELQAFEGGRAKSAAAGRGPGAGGRAEQGGGTSEGMGGDCGPHFGPVDGREAEGEAQFGGARWCCVGPRLRQQRGNAHKEEHDAHKVLLHRPKLAAYLRFMHTREEKLAAFGRLLDTMDELRAQCPWDRKQTFESLRHLTIEETYELADAILDGDLAEVRKETGDLLLHMVFYAKIASELPREEGGWDMADALHGICDKLVARHPHIYGDVEANDEDAVKANWERLKLQEGARSVLEGVPQSLPALVKAYRIQDKVRGVGFEFEQAADVWAKVEEELCEFRAEEAAGSARAADEFGDVLFALINYARFTGINPDEALERTNRRFIARFRHLEEAVVADGKQLGLVPLAELDQYWERAKSIHR